MDTKSSPSFAIQFSVLPSFFKKTMKMWDIKKQKTEGEGTGCYPVFTSPLARPGPQLGT
jgi:hypothetical protein